MLASDAAWGRGRPEAGEAKIRIAKVFALADLFGRFGHEFSAKDLYAYYLMCRVIASTRARGRDWRRWT